LTHYDPQIDPFNLPPIRTINPSVPKPIADAIEKAREMDSGRRTLTAEGVRSELFDAYSTEGGNPPGDHPRVSSRTGGQ